MFKKRPIAIAIAIGGLTAPSAYGQIEEVIVTATKRPESMQDLSLIHI